MLIIVKVIVFVLDIKKLLWFKVVCVGRLKFSCLVILVVVFGGGFKFFVKV